MRRPLATLLVCLPGFAPVAEAQYYVFGNHCSTCGTASSANHLYDDGLHGDGAAGDGVYGVSIAVDKPAGQYYWWVTGANPDGTPDGTFGWPTCERFEAPRIAALFTTAPGEVVQFRLFANPPGSGWAGSPVSCDRGMPLGSEFTVAFPSGPYCGSVTVLPATKSGTIWSRVVTWPTAGTRPMYFRATPVGPSFTRGYNVPCSGGMGMPCEVEHDYWVTFTTTVPDSDVRFEFDEVTGKMRAIVLGPTATRTSTWGSLKVLYR